MSSKIFGNFISSKSFSKTRDKLMWLRFFINPISNGNKILKIKKSSKLFHKNRSWGKLSDDLDTWIKSFQSLSVETSVGYEIADNFFNGNIQIMELKNNPDKDDIVLVCVVKDDLVRIMNLHTHYRNMGVHRFAILDNCSTDGTFEWLSEQNDVDLFKVTDSYSTNRRQAWINRVISFYGYSRWYIVVDSDELLMYEKMENKSIQDLIRFAKENNLNRIRTITLDVYPKIIEYNKSLDNDYLKKYVYFDSDNYREWEHGRFICIDGGMRVRMFKGNNEKFAPYLTKYPIFYFEKGDIQFNSHYAYPFYKNFDVPCLGALLHYKFLPSDFEKYKNIAESGNFYGGSYEYKQYVEILGGGKRTEFIYSGSIMFNNSKAFSKIKLIEKIGW